MADQMPWMGARDLTVKHLLAQETFDDLDSTADDVILCDAIVTGSF